MRFVILLLASLLNVTAHASEIRLAVTTSFNNSGLSAVLLPEIKKDIGLDVLLLVVGTGQAIKLGKSGDVDAILVHSKEVEEKLVASGYATHRREIMYNDFVVLGPKRDPANIRKAKNVQDAFMRIQKKKTPFVSRGDDSGTHKKEMLLWKEAGLKAASFKSVWYREVGSGMGASLNVASAMNAYILADRASWLNFSNKGDLDILFSGDAKLFNQYAYLPISPNKHPHVKHRAAVKLENWLVSKRAQTLIAEYKINGQLLFVPNPKPE